MRSVCAADSSPRPAIRQVEIGIKNHFKVGAWTPIRVETEGIEGLERPRVEVSVADSDGVPTSAASPLTATASTTAAVRRADLHRRRPSWGTQ